jgi:4-hydroxy 2-oxovalerate aldolase
VEQIFCAGFDGYSDKEDNYCNPSMEYGFVKQEAAHLNFHMKKKMMTISLTIIIMTIT